MVSARQLIGRTIVGFEPNPFDGRAHAHEEKRLAHDPVIKLDDGSDLLFITEETESGAYGVRIVKIKPRP
jgi:hypothetical protein